jgi:hypothetical protein
MRRRALLIAFAALLLGACEKPPQTEIDAAAKAYENSATNPDVITYAPDSLRNAQAKLAALRAEVDAQDKKGGLSRRYETAKTMAAEAKTAAESAEMEAVRSKGQAKTDATILLAGFADSISAFENKLWSAKRIRGIKLEADILTLAQSARAAVADADRDLAAGLYAAAKAKALTIQKQLADGEARVSKAVRLARGR